MRNLFLASAVLLLLGAGCESQPVTVVTPMASTTPAVAESFTFDDIETNGGIRPWLDTMSASQQRVRLPIIRVYAFGCETPTQYCVSTMTGGCYGPFVRLTGATEKIDALRRSCEQTCDNVDVWDLEKSPCSLKFTAETCSVLWDVEGRVASRAVPVPAIVDERCSANDPVYTIDVDRVVGPIGDPADDFEIRAYR